MYLFSHLCKLLAVNELLILLCRHNATKLEEPAAAQVACDITNKFVRLEANNGRGEATTPQTDTAHSDVAC